MAETDATLRDPKAIRCIVFDATGTLIQPAPGVAETYAIIGRRHGTRRTYAQIRESFQQSFANHFGSSSDRRSSEELDAQRWESVIADVLPDVVPAEACFREIFEHFARPEAWELFADVEPAVEGLIERGYSVVIASNFDRRLHGICEEQPSLAAWTRFISTEVGYAKPDRRFYEHIVQRQGLQSDQLLMVGDDFTNDVVGAVEAGLQAIRIQRNDDDKPCTAVASLVELNELLPRRR